MSPTVHPTAPETLFSQTLQIVWPREAGSSPHSKRAAFPFLPLPALCDQIAPRTRLPCKHLPGCARCTSAAPTDQGAIPEPVPRTTHRAAVKIQFNSTCRALRHRCDCYSIFCASWMASRIAGHCFWHGVCNDMSPFLEQELRFGSRTLCYNLPEATVPII
jgi:hypothetical protein